MFKKIRFTLIIIAIFGLGYFFKLNFSTSSMPTIVIAQVIDHNTLNTVRQGIIDGLAQHGYKDQQNIHIFYENAHGNYAISKQIADKFISLKPAVMVGLSTQSAQSLLSGSLKYHIPLVFSAVTDPKAAKLSGPTVTGVSDYMTPEPQIDLMIKMVPMLKRLGILYNPSEVNSVSMVKQFDKALKNKGVSIVHAPLHSTADATQAVNRLIGKVDAIYFPNDNTAMAAVRAIVAAATKHKIPVFANDAASVEQGALAAVAYDRHQMGLATADLVVKILKGVSPKSLPIVTDAPKTVVINEETAEALAM